jgi:chromosome segregation and condensation protein ScpB
MTGPRPAGRPWTRAEDDQLRAMLEAGVKAPAIGQKIKRTVSSVRTRKAVLEKRESGTEGEGKMTFATRLEHQFMQRLRRAGWVNATALPPSRRLVQTLLQKGWIEATRAGPKNVVLYRLTGEGLNAKKLPIPIPHRRRPSSKGKISD